MRYSVSNEIELRLLNQKLKKRTEACNLNVVELHSRILVLMISLGGFLKKNKVVSLLEFLVVDKTCSKSKLGSEQGPPFLYNSAAVSEAERSIEHTLWRQLKCCREGYDWHLRLPDLCVCVCVFSLVGEMLVEMFSLSLPLSLCWQLLGNGADWTGSCILRLGHYEKLLCLPSPRLALHVFLLNTLFTSLLAKRGSLLHWKKLFSPPTHPLLPLFKKIYMKSPFMLLRSGSQEVPPTGSAGPVGRCDWYWNSFLPQRAGTLGPMCQFAAGCLAADSGHCYLFCPAWQASHFCLNVMNVVFLWGGNSEEALRSKAAQYSHFIPFRTFLSLSLFLFWRGFFFSRAGTRTIVGLMIPL